MAYDQLQLYNEALIILGQRALSSLSEDREARHVLDDIYAAEPSEFCLELVRPAFARDTAALTSATPPAVPTYAFKHSVPADYVAFVEIYSDAGLNQPVSRYVREGDEIHTDHANIWLRYITSGYAITVWDISFAKVVAAYLAVEGAPRIAKKQLDHARDVFTTRVETAAAIAKETEIEQLRPANDSSSLSLDYLLRYNDALLILGLDDLITVNDDSNRRYKLSQALSSGIVEAELEDLSWQFGITSHQGFHNPSYTAVWGFSRSFDKPDDLHRLDGIFSDEFFQVPLDDYADEDGKWYCNLDIIYIKYVSTNFLVTPSAWPAYFQRLISARMALDAGPALKTEGADVDNAKEQYTSRRDSAMSNDAMASPPRKISNGDWTSVRYRGRRGSRR